MTTASMPTAGTLAAHAVCAAAGVRDGFRTAQFYARDLANADGGPSPTAPNATFLSRVVAVLARLTDQMLSLGADISIRLFYPSWRRLPSPFTPGIVRQVADAVRSNSIVHNPLFNSYFFRAAIRILDHYCDPPFLILEHRVDAARRRLSLMDNSGAETQVLARILIALVENGAVARIGTARQAPFTVFQGDPNVVVFAIACSALLFAKEGKLPGEINEDEFFGVTGALIAPRIGAIAALIAAGDEAGLAVELDDLRSMY
ncbi:MAG: hypothetical protein ACKVP5_04845 [Aestuariivirga sp.]